MSAPSSPTPRDVVSLNAQWRFRRATGDEPIDEQSDGHAWETAHLPHTVRLEPRNASAGRNYQGVCWYVRSIDVNESWRGRKLFLHFDGAMQVADVWLNDQKIATHYGGYTPFRIDISDFLRFDGNNVLTVRLNNSDNPQVPPGKPQRALDFTYFGGLYRNVHLEVTDRLHITDPILADKIAGGGIFVTYPKVTRDGAEIVVRTEVRNDHDRGLSCTIRQELISPDGRVVARAVDSGDISAGADATFAQTLQVANPLLWHPHHPHRYTLRTTVFDGVREADVQITRIGIRHIRFDANDGLFINHEKFCSFGANRHQDHPHVGYALSDSAHWRDVKKLREAGFTSCRSHYPQAPAFMDACDELGMLTIVSNPGWQFCGDAVFQQRATQNARTMVRRDRNRPSVILWEAALNETDNHSVLASLHKAVHEEFPGDQCYTAGDQESHFAAPPAGEGWDVHYLHNDGGKPYWIREWGDVVDNWTDQQSSNRVARAWGEGAMLTQAASYLARMNEILVAHHGTSTGPDARRLCGACLWAGIDYDRGYHHQPFLGGVLDAYRLPKFAYYFFQSQRPPDVHLPGLDDGPMVFIANFATPLSPTAITVFSNCESVRLTHNGREIGVRSPDAGHRIVHPPFTFQLDRFSAERSTMCMSPAPPGPTATSASELIAEGLIAGKVVTTHTVRPPGAAVKLMVDADLCGRELVADGADWLRIIARVCDSRGTTCPFADDLIHFHAEGEGLIVGDPPAPPAAALGANPVRAEAGIAVALVQATLRPGPILIRATSFGLAAGEVRIASAPPASPRAPYSAPAMPPISVQVGEGLTRARQPQSPVLIQP